MNAKEFGNKVLKGLIWFLHSYIWLFIIFLATDIITKQCVVRNLGPLSETERSITLIRSWDPNKPFLAISYVVNTNAAFSFGVGSHLANRIFYSIMALCGFAIIVTIFVWKYKKLHGVVKACLMLMAVGALSLGTAGLPSILTVSGFLLRKAVNPHHPACSPQAAMGSQVPHFPDHRHHTPSRGTGIP